MREQFFFEGRLKDFANGRREADGSELTWACCAGVIATGITIARRQSSGTWAVWSERLNIRASAGAMWELRAFEDLREKPIRASALMRVTAVQRTPDFQFSNEWVCRAGLCAWLEYEGLPLILTKEV